MSLFAPAGFDIVLWAFVIEALVGYPAWIERRIGHPVVWVGALIGFLDRKLNRIEVDANDRRRRGIVALVLMLIVVASAALSFAYLCRHVPFGLFIAALAAASLLAQRSLHSHVADVADGLDQEGLERGRALVARIVGRDPRFLDEAGIARAAIESLAENFSDGVAAPAFWLTLLGLPGMALYKSINTADSMIGHKTARHIDFGRAAARLDDWVNFPAARLAAWAIVAAALVVPGASARNGWRVMRRDARHHRSPNAGWPEAAMAGALGISLSGPRVYEGEQVVEPWIGDGERFLGPADIRRALKVYRAACGVLWTLAAVGALIVALVTR